MKKKNLIILSVILLSAVFLFAFWKLAPVHLLKDVEAGEISEVKIKNGINQKEFSVTSKEEVSFILENLKNTSFKRGPKALENEFWYELIFLNDSSKAVATVQIQNHSFLRLPEGRFLKGDLNSLADFLEKRGLELFHDYNKDTDFPY